MLNVMQSFSNVQRYSVNEMLSRFSINRLVYEYEGQFVLVLENSRACVDTYW